MKTITLKSLLLTVTLVTPLALIPAVVSGSNGHSRVSVSYSSGNHHGGSHVSVSRHHNSGYSRSHSSYNSRSSYSHHTPSYYSHYTPSYYSRYSSRNYYPRSSFSISIGSGSWGGYYSSLPRGYTSCVVGGLTYYNYGSRYYRPYNSGYVMVSNPYVGAPRQETYSTRTVSSKYDAYPTIWVDGEEYLIDEGELFQITRNGLVWADLPVGVVASSLPTHATSVWYKDVEYFEAGDLYFQRIPEGYRLILPPWDGEY